MEVVHIKLLNRIENTLKLVDDANFVRNQSNLVGDMNQIISKLVIQNDEMKKLKETKSTFSNNKIKYGTIVDSKKISKQIMKVINIDDTKDQLIALTELDAEINRQKNNLSTSWETYLDIESRNILQNAVIIDSLKGTSYVSDINRVVNNIKDSYPIKEIEVKILNEKRSKLTFITEKLNLNDTIKEFIFKLSSNNATMLDLNDEIIIWLKEHGFTHKIRLRMM